MGETIRCLLISTEYGMEVHVYQGRRRDRQLDRWPWISPSHARIFDGRDVWKRYVRRARCMETVRFARDFRYSDGCHAKTLPNGQKQMLVVDVQVGRSAMGERGMNRCPLFPGEQFVRYNSLVDAQDDPAIFVIKHSNQVYPAYLITYHK